jgi:hypothetical protein
MPCNTMQCNVMPCNAMQCNEMPYYATPCHAMLSYTMPCHAKSHHTMPGLPCSSTAHAVLPCACGWCVQRHPAWRVRMARDARSSLVSSLASSFSLASLGDALPGSSCYRRRHLRLRDLLRLRRRRCRRRLCQFHLLRRHLHLCCFRCHVLSLFIWIFFLRLNFKN